MGPILKPITIRSRNPNVITLDKAEEVAQTIRTLLPNYDVEVVGKEQEDRIYSVTYFRIVDIVLPFATTVGLIFRKKLTEEITRVAVEWARAWFKKRRGSVQRPVNIPIYGPNGKIVKSVVVKNATDEPEDHTEEDRRRRG
jgi:hypothetical protein